MASSLRSPFRAPQRVRGGEWGEFKESKVKVLGLDSSSGDAWSTLIIRKVETGVSQPDFEFSFFYLLDMWAYDLICIIEKINLSPKFGKDD